MTYPNLIAVLDLETTGDDEWRDVVLEVAVVLLDSDSLEEVTRYATVVWHPGTWLLRERAVKVVQEMHDANGLWEECARQPERSERLPSVLSVIDYDLAAWLRYHAGQSGRVPLAGSGVSHFDRRFISRQMPLTHERLTYWSYDVGVPRRIAELAGRKELQAPPPPDGAKAHRALDDALYHAEELRHWVALFEAYP